MPLPIAAAAAAAAPIGAGLIGFYGQERTNRANRAMAREQMAFQERMSSSSVQRQVEDFKAAGLNPALAYGAGGASSPGGSTAQMDDAVGRGVSSAMAYRGHMQNMRNLKATEDLTRTQEVETHERANKERAEYFQIQRLLPLIERKLAYDTGLSSATAAEIMKRVELMDVTKQHSFFGLSEARRRSQFWDSAAGGVAPYLSTARDFTGLLNPWLRR